MEKKAKATSLEEVQDQYVKLATEVEVWKGNTAVAGRNLEQLQEAFEELNRNMVQLAQDTNHSIDKFNEATDYLSMEVQGLWTTASSLEWRIDKVLAVLLPGEYPDPGPAPGADTTPVERPREENAGSTDQSTD